MNKTNFISLMPTNLYGSFDNFDLSDSHAFPGLIRKFYEAKRDNSLGSTGSPKREFLHSDDLASASTFLTKNYNQNEIINVSTGKDISIMELAAEIKDIINYSGEIKFDPKRPDGAKRKFLDVLKINNLGLVC